MEWLIFAHFIGDFAFQNKWLVENKSKSWYVLLTHSLIWTACVCITLQFLGIYSLWKAGFLVIGHFLVDYCKASVENQVKTAIIGDQMLHFVQLLFVRLF